MDILPAIQALAARFDIVEFDEQGCILRVNYEHLPTRSGDYELVRRLKEVIPDAQILGSGAVQDQKRKHIYQWWVMFSLEKTNGHQKEKEFLTPEIYFEDEEIPEPEPEQEDLFPKVKKTFKYKKKRAK